MKTLLTSKSITGLTLGLALLASNTNADDSGTLYTMDNATSGNHVLVLHRGAHGQLTMGGSVATDGLGTGTGLPSQGSVLLSHDGRWLFVCNAGSDEISVFAVSKQGLTLTDTVSSEGHLPLSLTLRHNLLYVLNAGGIIGDKDNITAFVFAHGNLTALPQSTRSLSGDNTAPAQASFTSDGQTLVVTERASNLIDTFSVGDDGLITEHKSFPSVGTTPFGFAVGRENRLFVSEAAGGAVNASSASSYDVSETGDLAVISGSALTHQTAACWLMISRNGRYAYTANAGSGSISGFRVSHDGSLQLLDADGQTGLTGNGSHPTDMVESRDGRFLYSLNNGNGTVSAFHALPNGSLCPLMVVTGLPTSSAGLAGR
jgi:6-phosphogluconolactonase (cycloisomerase 2 family)